MDGQGRFFANSHAPSGNMIIRHRLLAARGWAVLSVPHYLWAELSSDLRRAWLLQARGICPIGLCLWEGFRVYIQVR